MKFKINFTKLGFITLIIMLFTISGCRKELNGSRILSMKEVRNQNIQSLEITFFDTTNRIKSPSLILSAQQDHDKLHIDTFYQTLKSSKAVPSMDEITFSPPSDSSHEIKVRFNNDYTLEFYYSLEKNWLIWFNSFEKDEKKILQYEFMSPPDDSMEKLLSLIKPRAAIIE